MNIKKLFNKNSNKKMDKNTLYVMSKVDLHNEYLDVHFVKHDESFTSNEQKEYFLKKCEFFCNILCKRIGVPCEIIKRKKDDSLSFNTIRVPLKYIEAVSTNGILFGGMSLTLKIQHNKYYIYISLDYDRFDIILNEELFNKNDIIHQQIEVTDNYKVESIDFW